MEVEENVVLYDKNKQYYAEIFCGARHEYCTVVFQKVTRKERGKKKDCRSTLMTKKAKKEISFS